MNIVRHQLYFNIFLKNPLRTKPNITKYLIYIILFKKNYIKKTKIQTQTQTQTQI